MIDPLIDTLRGIVGAPHVLDALPDIAPFLSDWRGRYHGTARAVVRPQDAAELAAVVGACAAAGVPMVPQGGNTGLCGGATPLADGAAVVISLARLNRIRAIDADNDTLTVEAGCTLAAVQEAAAAVGRLFPLALASEGSCMIGGRIAARCRTRARTHRPRPMCSVPGCCRFCLGTGATRTSRRSAVTGSILGCWG